jgi:hypothetical protein
MEIFMGDFYVDERRDVARTSQKALVAQNSIDVKRNRPSKAFHLWDETIQFFARTQQTSFP